MLAVIAVLIIIAVVFPQFWFTPYYRIKWPESKEPFLYAVPIAREVKKSDFTFVIQSENTYNNFYFKTPYDLPRRESKNGITYFITSNDVSEHRIIALDNNGEVHQSLRNICSARPEYALLFDCYNRILRADLGKFTLNTKEAVDNLAFVLIKAIVMVGTPRRIFTFNNVTFRGFQVDDLETKNIGSDQVQLVLFDQDDNIYQLVIVGPNITQNEIDFILSSAKILAE